MPHILVVDSDPAEINAMLRARRGTGTGENYAAALQACRDDAHITIVAPYDGDALPPLERFDGVAFTGSMVDWDTEDARAAPLADAMRQVFDRGLPTLGSCNGMQLAASVLGGRSAASPNGREDGLARDIQLTEAGRTHPFLQGRTDGYAAPCVHRDEVTQLPQGAVLLAGNAHSGVQAMAYEQGGITFWGVQYHPELDPADLGPSLGRRGMIPAEEAAAMAAVEKDAGAAQALGVRADDMTPARRMTELRNWLNAL